MLEVFSQFVNVHSHLWPHRHYFVVTSFSPPACDPSSLMLFPVPRAQDSPPPCCHYPFSSATYSAPCDCSNTDATAVSRIRDKRFVEKCSVSSACHVTCHRDRMIRYNQGCRDRWQRKSPPVEAPVGGWCCSGNTVSSVDNVASDGGLSCSLSRVAKSSVCTQAYESASSLFPHQELMAQNSP